MSRYFRKLKIFIITKAIVTWSWIKSVGKAFRRESKETKIASKILLKMLRGKKVTPEEIHFLKSQSVDLGKALALIGLQAVPGSSFAIIAIEKVAQKYGFTLFPKEQKKPEEKKNV